MTILKKLIGTAVGAVVSYYTVKWITELLEEKPLNRRFDDVKTKAVDLKDTAEAKYYEAKDTVTNRVKAMSDKVDSLIREKSDKLDE